MTRQQAIWTLIDCRRLLIDGLVSVQADAITEAFDMAIDSLKAKQGKWLVEEVENVYGKTYRLTCSECGERFTVTEAALPEEHFCRGCGARMTERSE